MKRWLTGLVALLLLALSAHAAPALDGGVSEAEGVLNRAVKVRGGRKVEMNVTEFKTVDKLEDSLFKKPE
jgi:hypothetical protein